MEKKLLLITGVLGISAVILGAFGAHALAAKLTAAQLTTYHTGIEYHYYHTLALLGVVIMAQKSPNPIWLYRSAFCFIIGILFFSGSIYLLACKELLSLQNWTKIIGPITPIGGLLFILGWSFIILYGIKDEESLNSEVLDK